MKDRETYNLELKSKITDTYLKTVSVYANYNDGEIIFGIGDSGKVIELNELNDIAVRIENKINDNINPRPEYKIDIDTEKKMISLKVFEGDLKPYLFNSKAYMRRDSSTVPIVDREEMKRLTIKGLNLNYEDLPTNKSNLKFNYLEKYLINKLHIESLNLDILKTLGLYSNSDGYNIAGEIISDENTFKIVDIVKFGENINIFLDRSTLDNTSILKAYDISVEIYKRYYQYEKIEGMERVKIEKIPEDAFREAIANAIVHRDWSIRASIKISMFEDYIEITSPGGLPIGLSKEEYLNGQISILRNEKIGSLFNRLKLIEKFGTGIKRIKHLYKDNFKQPVFKVYENSISIILPVFSDEVNGLNVNARTLLEAMVKNKSMTRLELETLTGFDKIKTLRAIDQLLRENLVVKHGKGKATKYIRL